MTKRRGWSEQGLLKRKESLEKIARATLARSTCKRGHPWVEENIFWITTPRGNRTRRCKECVRFNDRKRSIKRSGGEAAVIPAGVSVFQHAQTKAWITRRSKYGPNGQSPREMVLRREHVRTNPVFIENNRKKTKCKRGHPFTPENTYIHGKRRERHCKTCVQLRTRKGRPEWIESHGVRVSILTHDKFHVREKLRLRQELIDSHPDRTGKRTDRRHIKAREALRAFLAAELEWYKQYGLTPPAKAKGGRRVATQSPSEDLHP